MDSIYCIDNLAVIQDGILSESDLFNLKWIPILQEDLNGTFPICIKIKCLNNI